MVALKLLPMPTTAALHPDTLPFLRELAAHNNRPWFNDNKPRWMAIKEAFEAFTQALIDAMEPLDPSLVGLTPKNTVYRIYRDTRFSADKSPYKSHIACFLSSWGAKNSGVPGYYFQLGCDEAYGLKGTCNLGGGIFMPSPEALAAIRQEIFYCTDEFLHILSQPAYKRYFGDTFFTTKVLSRVPKGYPADWPHAHLLKYKDYCTAYTLPLATGEESVADPDAPELDSPQLLEKVLEVWRASVPLNRFLQRAMGDGPCPPHAS